MDFYKKHLVSIDKNSLFKIFKTLNISSIEGLIEKVIPQDIRLKKDLNLPDAISEQDFLKKFKELSQKNEIYKTYIGMGYHDCFTPPVIQRNILENPGWYTAYTPYQAEISQGRLEMLLNFQTMISELTAMPLSNASLLDEASAAAEAMTLLYTFQKRHNNKVNTFLVDKNIHPQILSVLKSRSEPIGIRIVVEKLQKINTQILSLSANSSDHPIFGLLIAYPDTEGLIPDLDKIIENAKNLNIKLAFSTDLLALTLLKPPGEMGADVVIGSSQRFGVPMGYGGPHAAFIATHEAYKRLIPGRIIGVSKDADGHLAYRMALQTREQHIRREKATSNICTAQVLLANISAAYAIYHGAEGLTKIAKSIHLKTIKLFNNLKNLGLSPVHTSFFDTLIFKVETEILKKIKEEALKQKINFRYFEDTKIGISLNETTTTDDLIVIFECFKNSLNKLNFSKLIFKNDFSTDFSINTKNLRKSNFLTQNVFKFYQSEHELLRYLKRLENKDISLTNSMIPLGSCTMKLNATTEMLPLSWEKISKLHPFIPISQAEGYQIIINNLEKWLSEITGFKAVSFQPNSGAQGEYAGLMVIRAYHKSRGEDYRNIVLIPSSAHGTNPASAIMAGFKVIVVKCDERGNIDQKDLKRCCSQYKNNLAALMLTYPSTHGIFEPNIREVCKIVKDTGARIYLDGANMNAQIGLTQPALIGADICHLNLHKTFCIPHGGGGPGMGPIAVCEDLESFLPNQPYKSSQKEAIQPIAASPYGSASILPISYAYIALMGSDGLKKASQKAIINANYLKNRLEKEYSILYQNEYHRVGHEFIIDCRLFKDQNITAEDIAKRLIDYGFHAPTVSFPVPNTLMIEPTESETQAELDRFFEALIHIKKEINCIKTQKYSLQDNPIKNAPHTAQMLLKTNWEHSYTREEAAYPLPYLRDAKFWPSIRRIDNAFGDRNLICTCPDMSTYQ